MAAKGQRASRDKAAQVRKGRPLPKRRPTRTPRAKAAVASEDSAVRILELLEAHRDRTFRRVPSRRVTGEQSALAFINETGFCAAFTPGLGVPCLREAIEGRREPKLPSIFSTTARSS